MGGVSGGVVMGIGGKLVVNLCEKKEGKRAEDDEKEKEEEDFEVVVEG